MPHTKSPMDKFNDDYGRWHKNALDTVASERSIWIWLMNNTDEDVTWSDSGVDHGERCKLAPDKIAARDWGSWKLQSCGFQTGCKGWMTWVFDDGTKVELGYDNPYYGSNSYSCSVNSTSYTVTWGDWDGNGAIVKFNVIRIN